MSGIVYLITCNETGKQYVGSTTSGLNTRMSQHKNNMKMLDDGKQTSKCAAFDIIRRGHFSTQVLEAVNFGNDKRVLKQKEDLYISLYNACNIIKHPGRTHSEYMKTYVRNKEVKRATDQRYREKMGEELLAKKREYHHANKEAIAERTKIYREENKEKIAERKRQSYIANIEREHERRKVYRDANKEKIAEQNKASYQRKVATSKIKSQLIL